MALGMAGKTPFKGKGAFKTLELLAAVEGKESQEVAASYAGLLRNVRSRMTEPAKQAELDKTAAGYNLLWDKERGEYLTI